VSRIGKQPVTVPAGVKIKFADGKIVVEGPKGGPLDQAIHPRVKVELGKLTRAGDKTEFNPDPAGNVLVVTRQGDDRHSRAIHGLMRSLVANMVEGVTKGYEKKLKIEGVGFQAKLDKKSVVLMVGFANQITLTPPPGVTVEVPDAATIVVRGADKQKVGQFAAEVRGAKPPEPYQGKGVRYDKEVVRRKEGKAFSTGG